MVQTYRHFILSSYNLSLQLSAVTRGCVFDRNPERVRTADAKFPTPKLLSLIPHGLLTLLSRSHRLQELPVKGASRC